MAARLVVVRGDVASEEDIELQPDRVWTIGRDAGNELVILDDEASRCHCRVFCEDGRWYVEDLGSRNGTFIHGERISRRALTSGDAIAIAETRLRFELDGEEVVVVPAADEGYNIARLVVLDDRGEPSHRIGLSHDRPFSIGRTVRNDLMLETPRASRHHCHIEFRDSEWHLVDDQSRNGTYLDGLRVDDHVLHHKEVFRIGGVFLRFENDEDPEATMACKAKPDPTLSDFYAADQEEDATGDQLMPDHPLTVHLILSRSSVTGQAAGSEDTHAPADQGIEGLESPTRH